MARLVGVGALLAIAMCSWSVMGQTADDIPEANMDVCNYTITMPATVWLGSTLEAQVHVDKVHGMHAPNCNVELTAHTQESRRYFVPWRRYREPSTSSNISVSDSFQIVAGAEPKIISFDLPTEGQAGNQRLRVTVRGACHPNGAYSPCRFENSTNLHVEKGRTNVLIELDKPVYKPSQLIQGRIVAVDTKLLPVNGIIPLVHITDAKKSRVAQWRNVSLNNGIATFSLPLSSEPVLGDWRVTVSDQFTGAEVEEVFKVDEYVLPKFEVNVDGTKCLSDESSEYCMEVDARYTHGRPVKGTADIKFELLARHGNVLNWMYLNNDAMGSLGFEYPANTSIYRRYRYAYAQVTAMPIVMKQKLTASEEDPVRVCFDFRDVYVTFRQLFWNGRSYVPARIRPGYTGKKVLPLVQMRQQILSRVKMQASVVVTEGATGIERNGSVENTCYFSSPYRIEFQDGKYSGKFQPGLALSGSVKVSRHDEEPVGHGGLRVQMVCDIDVPTTKKPQRLLHQNLTVDAAGRAEFRIEKTPCSTTGVNCRAKLLKHQRPLQVNSFKSYKVQFSPTNTFVTNSLIGPEYELGQTARVPLCLFSCHEQDVYNIRYSINARGHVVHSGTQDVQRGGMDSVDGDCSESEETTQPPMTTEAEVTTEAGTVPVDDGSGFSPGLSEVTLIKRRPDPVRPHRFPIYPPGPTKAPRTCPCNCRRQCDLFLEFPVSARMGPRGTLTVYVTLSSGEMAVDTLDYKVSTIFENQVKIAFDSATYRPGAEANIHFSAAAGSTLAYSAVDKSLHILGGQNQITLGRVKRSVNLRSSFSAYIGGFRKCPSGYRGGSGFFPEEPFVLERAKRSSSPYPYFSYSSNYVDALDSWRDSNMVIMTSYNLATKPCPPVPRYPLYGSGYAEPDKDISSPDILDEAIERAPVAQPQAAPPQQDRDDVSEAPREKAEVKKTTVASKRSFFPETWLFKTLQLRESQSMENITVKVPDTITSWSAAAYAVSNQYGLGVADPAEITVFQPFFLSMQLPYSVIRCEILELPVSVFNYVPGCMQVTVELLDAPCYTNTGLNTVQELCLCTNDVDTVRFNISFNTLGDCPITVIARTGGTQPCMRDGETVANAVAVDRVRRVMKVEPAGVEMEHVESRYEVKKAHDKPYSIVFPISAPEDIVADSGRAWLSITGDLLGPSLEGLENLLRLPYGCGEQNMLNFAPGISIAKYLIETGQLDQMPSVKEKATRVILQGYQRENRYRHSNGAYSAFGENSWAGKKAEGCLWLTSFVVKSFCKAKSTELIAVDDEQICQSVEWIARQQERDGTFLDNGCLHHKAMMGGAQTTYSHTAYICLGLMELADMGCNCSSNTLMTAINKCKAYMSSEFSAASSPYAAAITCYGMAVGASPEAQRICRSLNERRSQPGCHWEQNHMEKPTCRNSWSCYRRQPSANVEITAYGLLANMRRGNDLSDQICIAKWLAGQRNSYGGFSSTQDTVIALDALARLSSRLYLDEGSNTQPLKVTYRYKPDSANTFDMEKHAITKHNKMVIFRRELRPIPGKLHIRIRGAGSALFQVAARYNVREEVPDAACSLSPSVFMRKEGEYVIEICTRWQQDNASNMALVTLKLPSGYTIMPDELDAMKGDASLQLERWDIDGRQVFFYFEEIDRVGKCFNVTMVQEMLVDKKQPTFIRVQDYYEPAHECTVEYSLDGQEKRCKTNYTYDSCHTPCKPQTCQAYLLGEPADPQLCDSGCRCKDNFLRLGDRCVMASDCKRLLNACSENEQQSDCSAGCQETCSDLTLGLPRICPFVCQRGCVCKPGYVRESEDGTCVPKDQCPDPFAKPDQGK
ncbi:C3 and PZP-like alpha-2-macroglobulin domain-containing protein 8 isoform X2 [Sycon ciliatum]|uniref:C3 and PZP-like alpha-2-macroglobulin domain-containing protein 8 isoform X2 n=1 Tax=Sycon ciliatum TaxID=27933 RepID=UPI0031F63913